MSVSILSADIFVVSDHNATVASVILSDDQANKELADATGASKREPYDIYNKEIAVNLAVGRALEKLGRDMKRKALRQVKDVTKAQEESKPAVPELRSDEVWFERVISAFTTVLGHTPHNERVSRYVPKVQHQASRKVKDQ